MGTYYYIGPLFPLTTANKVYPNIMYRRKQDDNGRVITASLCPVCESESEKRSYCEGQPGHSNLPLKQDHIIWKCRCGKMWRTATVSPCENNYLFDGIPE